MDFVAFQTLNVRIYIYFLFLLRILSHREPQAPRKGRALIGSKFVLQGGYILFLGECFEYPCSLSRTKQYESGSPRTKGNTDLLVQEALKAASGAGADTEFISLAGKKIKPCNACGTCQTEKSKGICAIKDDDVPGIFEVMKEADGIIVGSPVYFLSVTAQLKALFDRSVILRYAKGMPADRPGVPGGPEFLLKNKVGGAIAVGGGRDGGQLFTINHILQWMLAQSMIVVGNNFAMGGSALAGMKGDAQNDEIGLAMAKHVGLRVTEVAMALNKER